MKTIKIVKLKLNNFKQLGEHIIEPDGGNLLIYGANGTGKTSFADAFSWIFYGKNSRGQAVFDIKPLDENNQPIHNLEYEAEVEIDVDGQHIKLRRVLAEKWTKKRETGQLELTGHNTSYYIDGVPDIKQREYDDFVGMMAGSEEEFRTITNPAYFNEQVSPDLRRRALLELCGGISQEEVVSSSKELERLPGIIGKHTPDDHKKIVTARKKVIEEESKKIKARIEEANRSLSSITNGESEAAGAEVKSLDQQIKEANAKLMQLTSGAAVAEKRSELSSVEADMLRLETTHRRSIQTAIDKMEGVKRGINNRLNAFDYEISSNTSAIALHQSTIDKNTAEMDRLRDEFNLKAAIQFEYTQDSICPTCGQAIPEEQLQAAHEKALAAFNLDRSSKLERIKKTGKELSQIVSDHKESIARTKEKIAALQSQKQEVIKEIEEADKALLDLQDGLDSYHDKPEYAARYIREIDTLRDCNSLQEFQQDNTETFVSCGRGTENIGCTIISRFFIFIHVTNKNHILQSSFCHLFFIFSPQSGTWTHND